MVTALSGVIRTQGVRGNSPGWGDTAPAPAMVAPEDREAAPRRNPPPAIAVLKRKTRRDIPSAAESGERRRASALMSGPPLESFRSPRAPAGSPAPRSSSGSATSGNAPL